MSKKNPSQECKCKSCHKSFFKQSNQIKKTKNNNFCSKSCAATYNNKQRTKIRLCLNCNIQLKSYQEKFCGHNCQHDNYFKSKIIPRIEKGIEKYSLLLKRYLIQIKGHKCELCNLTKWLFKPIPLHLDHIDGDSDNCILSNIRLTCPNCHAQTKTFGFRGKHKNSKRCLYKRQYYKLQRRRESNPHFTP